MSRTRGPVLARAFDEAQFGPARILDLRSGMPSVADAIRRAEPWLRERQMAKAGTVLVITGRGAGSPDGVGAIRAAAVTLFARLKRAGVVARTTDHTPGSFVVELAPITALFESAPRSRGQQRAEPAPADPKVLAGLDDETRRELRLLAEYALAQLGAPTEPTFVEDEMLRQFSVLQECISPEETDREARFRFLVTTARHAFEEA